MFSKVLILALLAAFTAAQQQAEHHVAKPSQFGYTVKGDKGEHHREESTDGAGNVRGSYSITDAQGVHRIVDYVADKEGFRAQVRTNEPGTANRSPSNVHLDSSAHNQGNAAHGAPYVAPHGASYGVPQAQVYGAPQAQVYGAPQVQAYGVPQGGYAGMGYAGPVGGYGQLGYGLPNLGYERYGA